MIIIHAFLNVKPEKHEKFLEIANQMTRSTQAEEGCISFSFYEDTTEFGNFVFIEKFKNDDANKCHKETSHFKTFVKEISELLREPLYGEIYEVLSKS